ncbi:hypothetical protein PI124_g12246 [Phytophthora idaei]|nr:hypothetical protein PI125_g17211 [Phytophthora idaei]KAG3242926.1 hypothetical protein PI124_g12246 [Phytophthora idaei]
MNAARAGEIPRRRLVIHKAWRMHNHAPEMAASIGMKDLPTQVAVADTVAALRDSNASSNEIAGYMSVELGKDVCIG